MINRVNLLTVLVLLSLTGCNSGSSSPDTPDGGNGGETAPPTKIEGTPDSAQIQQVLSQGEVVIDTTIIVPEDDNGVRIFTLSPDINDKGTLTIASGTLTISKN
ncbi:hypothetical protein [Thaumasiovibrio sp. DFM-14]|uniref:hypothetical protein n=1 Tax=Thaumasiovibrio sp. DFM-14 TaxID=3384792 RepID=UPI00399FB37E